MSFIPDDDVIQTLSPYRTDRAFNKPVLPGRSRRGRAVTDGHRPQSATVGFAIGAIVVADDKFRGVAPWKSLGNFMRDPFGGRIGSNGKTE